MKKSIFVISADWHLQSSNIELIKSLVTQKCELASSLNIKEVIVLGDLIHSRIAQRLDILIGFLEILDIFSNWGIKLIAIPGNHEKSNYLSINSFLDPFQFHPNFELIREYQPLQSNGTTFHLLPFFRDEMWLEYFNKIQLSDSSNVLLTHVGFQGSKNNDGSKHQSSIIPSLFKNWELVLSGHFHDLQTVSSNIFHIPSICQNNFGEDLEKGFTVLYDDLTFETVVSKFPKYITVQVDLDKQSPKEYTPVLSAAIAHAKESTDRFRFEFTGDSSKLKSIDKEQYSSVGIDVKIKSKEIEEVETEKYQEVKQYSTTDIQNLFQEFCEQENIDHKTGSKYLNLKLI